MDNRNGEIDNGQEGKLRMDVLDRFELYQTMAGVFFDRLTKEEKVDALLEVINLMNGGTKE